MLGFLLKKKKDFRNSPPQNSFRTLENFNPCSISLASLICFLLHARQHQTLATVWKGLSAITISHVLVSKHFRSIVLRVMPRKINVCACQKHQRISYTDRERQRKASSDIEMATLSIPLSRNGLSLRNSYPKRHAFPIPELHSSIRISCSGMIIVSLIISLFFFFFFFLVC
jgi:hypothetical protein